MQKLIAFFSILFSFLSNILAQQADSIKRLPQAKWLRAQTIDVKHIALDLQFDWKKKQAIGTATITLSPLKETDKVFLDAGMLTINSISLPNGNALKFIYDGGDKDEGLEINLNRLYKPEESITFTINYHSNWINKSDPNAIGGSFGKGLRFFEPTVSAPIKRKQLWAMGEAEGNRYWFPCYDSPEDARTTELTTTVAKNLTVVSNGDLIEAKDNSDGTKTFHYKTSRPYPNYLTTLAIGEYVDVKQTYAGIPFHTYCYPDEKTAAEATTERLTDMVKFFTELTGVKYPYKTYSQVMVQDFPFPGLVGQNTVSIISDNMIDDYRTHADYLYLWDGVEANALASQWFGNMITVKDWSHEWLVKAFANYIEGLYTSYKNGHDEYLMWYQPFEMGNVLGDWNAGVRHPIVTKNFDNVENYVTGDNYLKYRGSLVLRMLRKEIGDGNWWKAIKHFVKHSAFKSVSTEDLQKAVKEATGINMDWFFDQWVYKMGHPIFEVSKSYDKINKQLDLVLKQIQKPDSNNSYPQVDFFKGKLEIEIDKRIETVWIEPQLENKFSFQVAQEPKLVNADFESHWIKEIKFEKSFGELLFQFQNDKDILGRNAAMAELVGIAKKETTSDADREKIQKAFRVVIEGKSYWRLKTAAISQLNNLFLKSIDKPTVNMLLKIIKNEKALLKASAIGALGSTNNEKYADIFIDCLNDSSDRVIFSAAAALGKTKSPKAFDALVKLKDKPSWKQQSLMAALTGLRQLGDKRGVAVALAALKDNTSPRWFLGNFWDYPFVAAQTLTALGEGSEGYPIIWKRFNQSMEDGDINDIFQNVLLITALADSRGQEAFDLLKDKFKNDKDVMAAVNNYETQFKEAIKK